MSNDIHDTIQLRLPSAMVEVINQVAHDANVTVNQAASVITVLTMHRLLAQHDTPDAQEAREELSPYAQSLKDDYTDVHSSHEHAHRTRLVIDNQTFDVGPVCYTVEEADFFARMLAKGLEKIIEIECPEGP